jgi:hypothetical protein
MAKVQLTRLLERPNAGLVATLAGVLCLTSTSLAQVLPLPGVTIDLPDVQLQPNTSTSFDILVHNSGSPVAVNGVNVYIGIDTGGPVITALDVVSGTIFDPNNNGLLNDGLNSSVAFGGTKTSSGTVNITSDSDPVNTKKLASLTLNTAGVAPGTYTYTLQPILSGETEPSPTTYTLAGTTPPDRQPTLLTGQLTVVPEPSASMAVTGLGCLVLGLLVRRSRR